MAFGLAVERFVIPALGSDNALVAGAIGVSCGVLILSLSSFFALRRITLHAVERMSSDNRRLQEILTVSGELSSSRHVQAVAETALGCARSLTGSEAAYLLIRGAEDKPLDLTMSSGQEAQALFEAHSGILMQLCEKSLIEGRPVWLNSGSDRSQESGDGEAPALSAAVALPMAAEGAATGTLVVIDTTPGRVFEEAARGALTTLSSLTSVSLHNADLQDAQRNFFAHITDVLVTVMDAHVEGRKGHAHAVASLANRLGREMRLEEERMQTLHFSALLHDIGMLKIPAGQQRSPGQFQKHPVLGYRILSRIRIWEEVAPIVLHHHEWYDGAGYPEGLAGSAIPLESRIIAVADCFDALKRNEAHRMAMTIDEALSEIRKFAGTQFDPDVVVALAKLAERGELEDAAG
jgi:putative nucleotidyltransferase with HDIG domain